MIQMKKIFKGIWAIFVILSIFDFANGFIEDNIVSSDGINLAICPFTKHCQLMECGKTPSYTSECWCDAACRYYDDCCYDYSSTCNTTASPPPTVDANELQCIEGNARSGIPYYYVIGACKYDSPVDSEAISKCEHPDTGDILLSIIVSDEDDNIYKNVYCALCNGVSITEVNAWEVTYECDEFDVSRQFEVDIPSFQVRPEFPNNQPQGTTRQPQAPAKANTDIHTRLGQGVFCIEVISFKPPKGKHDNRRICDPNVIKSCNKNYFNETVIKACENGNTAVVYDKERCGKPYKNHHCAICNNMNYTCPKEVCGTSFGGPNDRPLTPLTIIVDFSYKNKITVNSQFKSYVTEGVTCATGEVYDPFTNKCLKVTCKNGFILQDSKCVSLLPRSYLPVLFDSYSETTIRTPVEIFCLCSSEKQSMNVEYQYLNGEHNFTSVGLFTENLNLIGVQYMEHISNHSNMTAIIITITSINCQLAYNISDIVNDIIDNKNDLPLKVIAIKQNCLQNTLPKSLICDYETFLLTSKFLENNFYNTKRTFQQGNSSTYVPEDGYVLKIIHQNSQFSIVSSSISVSTCEVCPQIQLPASAFTDDIDGGLLHVLTGKLFKRSEYVFLNSPDNSSVLVCSFLNQTQLLVVRTQMFYYTGGLLLTSVIGTIFSLIGLFITIVMRVMYSELRALSGKIILNISITLFSALFLTLVQGYFVKRKTICEVLAVSLHYLWLVCFTWMNIMAFELFKTFRFFRPSVRSRRSQTKSFIIYCVYSWGIPAIYVTIIVSMIHWKGMDLNLMYGDDSVCWIRDEIASFYVFGIPMALILLPNLILFVATITGIRSVKQSTSGITGKTKKQEAVDEMVIYIRISAVMGLSWIFGFLASFIDHVILWYLFIILNTLQGLFIFIAFNINHSIKKVIMKTHKKNESSVPLRTFRNTSSTDQIQ